jgi:hypothetical protein
MGTKNNPGEFDCYAEAKPDEPMFVLLGRDPDGPLLVEIWARQRELRGEDAAKVAEARDCAEAMRIWQTPTKEAEGWEENPNPTGSGAWLPEVERE